MQLVRENPGGIHQFSRADSAGATVAGRTLASSFIVTPQWLQADWPVRRLSELDSTTISEVLAAAPEVLIVGTDESMTRLPPETRAAAGAAGVGIEVMAHDAAARTFNLLALEDRSVVAAMIIAPR